MAGARTVGAIGKKLALRPMSVARRTSARARSTSSSGIMAVQTYRGETAWNSAAQSLIARAPAATISGVRML